jgi:hypothetical protein
MKCKKVLIEENLINFYKLFNPIIVKEKNIDFSYNFFKSLERAWPNYVFNLAINTKRATIDAIRDIKQLIKEKKIPDTIIVGSMSTPHNIAELLIEESFSLLDHWSGMCLEKERGLLSIPVVNNFYIEKVTSKMHLNKWISIVEDVLFQGIQFKNSIIYNLLEEKHISFYLGVCNDKPVSTSLSYYDGTSIGLYMIATIKEYRKMGFGSFLTQNMIFDAERASHFRPIVLQSTEVGERVYKKLGFKKVSNLFIISLKV